MQDLPKIDYPSWMPEQIPALIYKHENTKLKRFTKFIIDTDAGGDDAHAILIAHHIIATYR
jgi:purine nucleosidase